MKDLFEELGEDLNPTNNAELIRQAKLEAQIKQIQSDD